jgi:hypothetical protein
MKEKEMSICLISSIRTEVEEERTIREVKERYKYPPFFNGLLSAAVPQLNCDIAVL